MAHDPLHGACSCGRNQYSIQIPDDVIEHAEVYFDSSRDNRKLTFNINLVLNCALIMNDMQVDSTEHRSPHGCEYRWIGSNPTLGRSSRTRLMLPSDAPIHRVMRLTHGVFSVDFAERL